MSEIVVDPAMPVPAPSVSPDTAEFWAATREGRLLIKRCTACGEAHWYPRPICPFCHSGETTWEEAGGRGTVYTFSILRRARGGWAALTPYIVAYVELAEGPRIMTNIVVSDVDSVRIGDPVEVVFHAASEGHVVPRFRPVVAGTAH